METQTKETPLPEWMGNSKKIGPSIILDPACDFKDVPMTIGNRYGAILIPESRKDEFMNSGGMMWAQHMTEHVIFFTEIHRLVDSLL